MAFVSITTYSKCMAQKLDPKVAEAVMLKAGLEPLEPYRNNRHKWKSRCLKCERIVTPRYESIKQGHSGCIYCSGNKVDSKDAEAIMLNAGLKPLEPFKSATAKWRCLHIACGEIVSPQYSQIQGGQGGCLKCGRKRTVEAQRIPKAKAVAVMLGASLRPLEEFNEAKKPWKCECLKCGKTVSPTYSAIRNGQGGCKYCARKFVDAEDAIQVMISGGFEPLEDYSGAGKPWRSKCVACGFVSSPTFANVQNGSICTKCANKENGIKQRLPEDIAIAQMLKAKLQPLEPFPGTKIPWKSKCLVCDHEVTPALGNIIQGHGGCGYCSGHIVEVDVAIAAMVAAGLTPLEDYKGSDMPWKCRHDVCGKVVSPSYASIRRGQGGCRSCGVKEGGKKNTLNEIEAINVMLSANLQPLEPYIKSENPWKCRCMVCKKTVYPRYSNIKSGNSGCLYCAGAKVDEEDAIALMRKNGLEPLEPFVDSKKKWKCRHLKCGNIVYPIYNTIQNRGGGCSTCAEWGLTYNAPAYLYILQHDVYQSIKIGISNDSATPNRVRSHQSDGWKHYKSFYFATGQIAEDIENEVLNWLRNEKQLGIHLSKELMKQGGYSETVDAMEISVLEIERYLRKILSELQD